jgi:hypothetical protein
MSRHDQTLHRDKMLTKGLTNRGDGDRSVWDASRHPHKLVVPKYRPVKAATYRQKQPRTASDIEALERALAKRTRKAAAVGRAA